MAATITFAKAEKSQAKARIGLIGPAGSGKTYTALRMASAMGQKIAVIDTEHGSASKYADEFTFDVATLPDFDPRTYMAAIQAAAESGYEVLVIDSASHEWYACLEMVDRQAPRFGGNAWAAWSQVTPLHRKFVDTLLDAPLHVIATFRAKTEYAQVTGANGKTEIQKVGVGAVTRDGMEYELDIIGELDLSHVLTITKTRYRDIANKQFEQPGEDLAKLILQWLQAGAPTETVERLTTEQGKQLWAFAQQHQLDVPALLTLVNSLLGTAHTSLRDLSRAEADRLLADIASGILTVPSAEPIPPTDGSTAKAL
ncbi:AAA ATPase [Sulfobacillus acidophilus TPY]|uniref:AAA ATPase n=1 Tax=Sulfobacillus acidophilus (strain ATCC 700253 / DSM 10332 / NAL) TaxID=679936 RepID=G8U0H8_SULAD|nr:AAA ATPase [Sulfobacillus acidophilus TPY]AEW04200.1 AAA ATPase [Sulfobacillus acidophilus DSM 10332]